MWYWFVWKGCVGVQCSWGKHIFTRGMDDAEECPCSQAYARSISRDQRSRVEYIHHLFKKGVLARRHYQQSPQSWLPWMDWAHPKVSHLQISATALKLWSYDIHVDTDCHLFWFRCNKDGHDGVKKYKEEQRKRLINQGYRLWGIVGDQWSSLSGHPHAKRTFKIPNPMYYVAWVNQHSTFLVTIFCNMGCNQ